MFYDIKFSDYPHSSRSNLLYHNNLLILHPEYATQGEILSPPLTPALGYQWTGLDIEGSQDIEIAIASQGAPLTYYSFSGGSVQTSHIPTFYNLTQARVHLVSWAKGVRFLFRLTRRSDGSSPYISGFLISSKVLGEPLSYLADYGLPLFLKRPYHLERIASTNEVGAIAMPSGFSPLKLSGITRFITIPEKKVLIGSHFANSNLLVFQPVVPNQQGYLTFDYIPGVEALSGNGFAQVTEVPSIFVKYLEDSHVMNVRADRWTTSPFGILHDRVERQRNLTFEVRIIAETIKDIRCIASGIYEAIAAEGNVYLAPYARKIPIRISKILQETGNQPQSSIIKESLASATLHLEVIHWEN